MKRKWWIGVLLLIGLVLVITEVQWTNGRDHSAKQEHTNATGNLVQGEYLGAAQGNGGGLNIENNDYQMNQAMAGGEVSVDFNFGTGSADSIKEAALNGVAFDGEHVQETVTQLLLTCSNTFTRGYPVDETFFQWFIQSYGMEAFGLVYHHVMQNGAAGQDVQLWYTVTGKSMHVLWLEYCKDRQYATYQLAEVTWKECASDEKTVIDVIGDINFDEDWYTMEAYKNRQEDINQCISESIQNELQSADLALLNNEFAYSDRGTPTPGKAYTFRAAPSRIGLLHTLGIDLVSLANNHIYDYGEEALDDTIHLLEENTIEFVGAGHNLKEAKKIEYFVANGRKIAFVSATQIEKYSTQTKEATVDSAGVLKTLNPDIFVSVIEEANQNSDYVIVYVHWGVEGRLYIEEDQRALAEAYIAAGADVIVGNHSHRLQGIEYMNGVPVLHSLGNFWFSTGTLYTAIAQICILEDGQLQVNYVPCKQENMSVIMLEDEEEVADFYRYLADISENIGISREGSIYNLETIDEEEKNKLSYFSGEKYAERTGAYDLENRRIDIVGNLVNE